MRDPPSPTALALAIVPGTLLAGIAGGIVFPIFPIVGRRVGLSLVFIGVILAANRAARVIASPLVGLMTDRIGGRRTLLVGLATQVCVMALYILGMLTHHEGIGFLAGRIVHGPGSACVFVAAQALAMQAGGISSGGGAAGTVRAAIVLGIPIGFVTGGVLSDAVGEVATFFVAGASVVLAFAVASFTVPDLRASVPARASLGETLRALRDKRLLAAGALNFVLAFAAGGMVLTTLAFVVEQRHITILGRSAQGSSGLLMGLMSITDALATPFAGRLGDRLRAHAHVAAVSAALVSAGLVVVGLAHGLLGTAGGVMLVGVGTAGLGPSVLVLVSAIMPPDRKGTGAGLLQLCADLGGMLGPLLGTAFFASGIAMPYLVTAIIAALSVPLALSLTSVERAPN